MNSSSTILRKLTTEGGEILYLFVYVSVEDLSNPASIQQVPQQTKGSNRIWVQWIYNKNDGSFEECNGTQIGGSPFNPLAPALPVYLLFFIPTLLVFPFWGELGGIWDDVTCCHLGFLGSNPLKQLRTWALSRKVLTQWHHYEVLKFATRTVLLCRE